MAKVEVQRTISTEPAHFQRMFIMFDAQKRAFLAGCRPVIGFKACYLKGPFEGQLIAAVSRDANNQMYPLAMGMQRFLDVVSQVDD